VDLPVINTIPSSGEPAAGGGCASHSCGSTDNPLGHLPEHIRAKVHNHPFYSEQAHH
jgi:nitrogen fixation protein NifB